MCTADPLYGSHPRWLTTRVAPFEQHLQHPTFVVLAEIHHAGDSATCAMGLRAASGAAQRQLALSGTPTRAVGHPAEQEGMSNLRGKAIAGLTRAAAE
jgi:hypothetical protein